MTGKENKNRFEGDKSARFPFDKMPYQDREDDPKQLEEYDLESNEELDLGESEKRAKKRTLRQEKGAGQEPAMTDEEE